MKVWCGKEQETKLKIPTLYIQGRTFNIIKVLELAEQNKVNRLYFGAGKVDIEESYQNFILLQKIPYKYQIVVETSNPTLPVPEGVELILRTTVPSISKIKTLKFEDANLILTFTKDGGKYVVNKISKKSLNPRTLMYNTDKLLLEDEE